jgi:pimeloyl-ACP methyl ester carboxylesterase
MSQDLRNHGSSPHNRTHDYIHLAKDVEAFIAKHDLRRPTLIGHSMGAKTAMTIALRQPSLIANLIAVDNAPVDAALKSDFRSYVKGMQEVEKAKVKKQMEADQILKPYAKVGRRTPINRLESTLKQTSLCVCRS